MEDFLPEIDVFRCVNACVYEDIKFFGFFSESDNCNTSNNSLYILHVNVRSYSRHVDELLVILNGYSKKFDIIVLSETWLCESGEIVRMDGYDVFVNKESRNQNDGVVVYVNKCLAASCEEVSLYGATSIKVDMSLGGERQCLLAVYRSPSPARDLELFINDLESYCDNRPRDRTHWLVGDINCCILPDSYNVLSQRYLDILYTAGFFSIINCPTRVTESTSSCIDHIFVDTKCAHLVKSGVIKSEMTDHYFIVAKMDGISKMSDSCDRNFFCYFNENHASKLIREHDWSTVTGTNDVNLSCSIFVNNLKTIIKDSTKNVRVASKYVKIKPWITKGLLISIRKRDKMSKQLKKQPFNPDLKSRFHNYRNLLRDLIKTVKDNYYRRKILGSGGDCRVLWKHIGEIMGVTKNKERFPINNFFLNKDKVDDSNVTAIANAMNEYYVNVGASLASAVPPVAECVVDDEDHRMDSVFQLLPVTEAELVKCVTSIKGKSAPGVDGIPTSLIKNNIFYLISPLLHIVNGSINQGIFPDIFKIGKVIPIYKGGQKDQFVSYRPITLASTFAKILEKCVKMQLQNYIIGNNILIEQQFGFRVDKNLNDDLFLLTKDIHNSIGKNRKVLLVFIDLAKAFDTVDRNILCKKLECIGVRGISLEWFKSYLKDRYQLVSILGQNSFLQKIDYGVIQGSTLGPLLFTIFINNLGKINIHDGRLFLYADDTALLFEGNTWNDTFGAAERGLLEVKHWFDQNRLTVNLNKTKCLPISLKVDADPINQQLILHTCGDRRDCRGCVCLENVSEYKYLGVIFDKRMNWSPHINYMRSKLRRFVYIFFSLNKIISPKLLKTVYYAYVQSLLQYGILAWGGAFKCYKSVLATLQNSVIRAALNRPLRYSTSLLYDEFKVFTINQLYTRALALYIFKNKFFMFNAISHNYSTRTLQNHGIIIPRIYKTINITCSYYIASRLYINMPGEIKNYTISHINRYRKLVDRWIMDLGREGVDSLFDNLFLR